jgi:uncharacterized membrane protein YhhN
MTTALWVAPLLGIALILLVRAEVLVRRAQIYVLKPLCASCLLAVALMAFRAPGRNDVYATGILVGMLFSVAGDLALMFQERRKAFMAGLALFLIAHIAYATVFTMLGGFSVWDVLSTAVLLVVAVGFYRLVGPRLGPMKLPVIAYIAVVSAMVSRALSVVVSPAFTAQQATMVAAGAVLFYCSDMILAANRFWRPWKYHRLSLIPYIGGQFLIAMAGSLFV